MAWTHHDNTLSRPLGDSERAFVRGAGSDGVGDMFLHLDFWAEGHAVEETMARERVVLAWAIIRVMHPLLMCEIDVQNELFRFHTPLTVQSLLTTASSSLTLATPLHPLSRLTLIHTHLNASPRQHLSSTHLSHLTISKTTEPLYHIFMVAPHFIGDGTALHQSTHDLLVLLTSEKSNAELMTQLEEAWKSLRVCWSRHLPPAVEHLLPPPPSSPLALAASKINFLKVTQREIGGHVLPRVPPPSGASASAPPRTTFVEHVFSEEETARVLKKCKEKGVSVNHLMVAACAVAWGLLQRKAAEWKEKSKNPVMIYTAVNLRGYLPPPPPPPPALPFPRTYWFLPLTYYTVSLPAYLPSASSSSSSSTPTPLTHLIWSRARLAKQQTATIVKSRWLVDRARIMAAKRAGSSSPTTSDPIITRSSSSGHAKWHLNLQDDAQLPPHARPAATATATAAPSKALLGVSLIGNLDRTYLREEYGAGPGGSSSSPCRVHLKSVTTASKLKRGGILLLVHTFAGKLWVQVVWDADAFERGWIEGEEGTKEGGEEGEGEGGSSVGSGGFVREVVRVVEVATDG